MEMSSIRGNARRCATLSTRVIPPLPPITTVSAPCVILERVLLNIFIVAVYVAVAYRLSRGAGPGGLGEGAGTGTWSPLEGLGALQQGLARAIAEGIVLSVQRSASEAPELADRAGRGGGEIDRHDFEMFYKDEVPLRGRAAAGGTTDSKAGDTGRQVVKIKAYSPQVFRMIRAVRDVQDKSFLSAFLRPHGSSQDVPLCPLTSLPPSTHPLFPLSPAQASGLLCRGVSDFPPLVTHDRRFLISPISYAQARFLRKVSTDWEPQAMRLGIIV